ncbi:MAG TPA: hypothetical protein VKY74_18405 [Chloroflexia bacterium]|nr:hypothetical protein [Chloroflexia bacterium]
MRSPIWRYLGSSLPALFLMLTVGCDRTINLANKSTHAASVSVSIPEASSPSLINLDPGQEDAADLGDSGVYTVNVLADTVVVGAMTKVRDDLEAQLQNATTPAQIQDLTAKLQATGKFLDQLNSRAASCGGKVDEGDAYVSIGWDDAKQAFTASCLSKGPAPASSP